MPNPGGHVVDEQRADAVDVPDRLVDAGVQGVECLAGLQILGDLQKDALRFQERRQGPPLVVRVPLAGRRLAMGGPADRSLQRIAVPETLQLGLGVGPVVAEVDVHDRVVRAEFFLPPAPATHVAGTSAGQSRGHLGALRGLIDSGCLL
jgi:hypothetical protein